MPASIVSGLATPGRTLAILAALAVAALAALALALSVGSVAVDSAAILARSPANLRTAPPSSANCACPARWRRSP